MTVGKIGISIIVFLLLMFTSVQGTLCQTTYTWTGNTSTAWATTTNWSPNGNPGSGTGDIVIITTATNQPVLTIAPANSLGSLTFAPATSATILSLTITGVTLQVIGAVTFNSQAGYNSAYTLTGTGTLSCGSLAVGTTVTPTSSRTTTLTFTLTNLTVTNNITINSVFNTNRVNCTFTHTSGIVNAAGITTVTPTGSTSTYSMGNTNPTLQLTSATPFTIGAGGTNTITLNGTGATVDYQSTSNVSFLASPNGLLTYTNLIISGGSGNIKTLGANVTVSAGLTVRAASTLAMLTFTIGTPTSLTLETLGGGVGSAITGSGQLTLGGNVTVNYTGSGPITTGASIAAPIALGNGTRTFTVNDDGNSDVDLSIIGIISGTGGMTKSGTGSTMYISGANTYTGLTTISAGTLQLGNTSALGTTASGTTITSGAVLDLNGITYSNAEALTINGTGISSGGAVINSSSTAATFAGLITLGSTSSIIANSGAISISNAGTIAGPGNGLTLGGSGGGTLTSILGTGTGTLTINGGTWTISGANTYTGLTTVSAGTLKLGAAGGGTNTPLGTTAAGTIVSAGAVLDLNGFTLGTAEALTLNGTGISSGGALINSSATAATYSGLVTLGSTSSIIASSGAINISNAGTITGSGYGLTLGGSGGGTLTSILGTGAGTLTISGGTWLLSGVNSYTGFTTISSGTLKLGAAETNLTSVTDNATLDLDGHNQTIGSLLGSGSVTSSVSGSITLTTGGDNSNTNFSGIIANGSGTVSMSKAGSGTFTLSGANSYSGLTTIGSGTLQLNNPNALGGTTNGTIITSGAVLDLNGITYSNAEALTINGTGISSGGAVINSSSTAATFAGLITLGSTSSIIANSGAINISNAGTITGSGYGLTLGGPGGGTLTSILGTGAGTLTINGGTWTISGANTYTGLTTVSAGTLKLGAAGGGTNTPLGTTAAGTIVSAGAVLDLNGFTMGTAEALTLNGTGISGGGALINSSATAATYSGLVTLGSTSSIIASSGAINIINAGTITGSGYGLTLGGPGGGTLTSILGTGAGTLTINGGTWTISGANTYTGLTTVSAGTLKLGAAGGGTNTPLGTTTAGTIVSAGAVLDLNGFTLGTAEALTLNGTGISGGGALINSSATAATYSGSLTFGSASSIGTTGNITLGSNGITGGYDLTKVGTGTLNMGTGSISIGNFNINAGSLTSTSNTLNLTGNFSNNGTFSNNSGTVNFDGSGAQNVAGTTSTNYYNLDFSNAGTKTLIAAITVTGNLSINSGVIADLVTYTSSTGTLTLGGSGTINGSWGSSGSAATNTNDIYFTAPHTGILNVSTSTCVAPSAPTSGGNQTMCSGQTIPALTVTVGTGQTADWYSASTGGTLLASSTLNYTPTGPGTYYAQARSITTYCISTTRTGVTLTVNPTPAITNMTTAVCSGTGFTVTPVNGTNGIVPSGTTYSWPAPSGSGFTGGASGSNASSITGTLTNTTNTTQTATYTVTPTAGSCTGSTFTVTVTLNPTPVISVMTTTVCSGTGFTVTPVNGTNGIVPSGTTYSWPAPSGSGFTGGASGSNASSITGTLTNTTNTTQTATYTVTPTAGSCTGSTFTVTVTLNPTPTVTNTPLSQTICSGGSTTLVTLTSNVSGTTFTWTATATAGVSGFTANGTSTIPVQTITTTATTQGSVTYAITPNASGCAGSVTDYLVYVTPIPTATISYAGNPFCNSLITSQPVTLTGTGAYTGGIYSSTTGLTINSSTGAITPSTSTAGMYTVTYTIPASGGCTTVPVTTSVTITALPVATFSYTGSPYCQNAGNPYPTFSGGGVAGTFSSTAGLVFVSTSTGEVDLASSAPGTYTVTNMIAASGGCPVVTATSPITINPNLPVSVLISASPSGAICAGTSVTFTALPTNGGTAPIYQWQKNGINVGTNSPTYTDSGLVNGDVITCILTSNSTCPTNNPATSNAITMTVNPIMTVSVIISASPSGAICQGTNVTFTANPVNGGSSPIYQWKKDGFNVGTNSPVYSDSTLVNNDAILCILTSNINCPSGNPATSNTISMVVNPLLPVSVSISANPSGPICSGTSVTFTAVPANGGITPVYQWKKNGNNVGASSPTYTDAGLNNNDVITCIVTSDATCPTNNPATSNSITMTVNPTPTSPVSVVANPASIYSTYSGTVILTASGGGNGNGDILRWYAGGCGSGSPIGSGNPFTIAAPYVTTTYYARWENGSCYSGCVATTVTVFEVFRSRASDDWSNLSTWEVFTNDGMLWVPPDHFPTALDGTITLMSPNVVTVSPTTGNINVDELTINAGAELLVNVCPSGYWLTIQNGPGTDITVNGTMEYQDDAVQLVNGATMVVGSGGVYQPNMTYGGNYPITIPTALWDSNSTCNIIASNQLPIASGLSQTFGNFTWNYSGQTTSINLGGSLQNITGNFTITSTGSVSTLQLTNSNNLTLNIGKDLIIQSGILDFSNGAASTKVINLHGNYNQTGGTFTNSNSNPLTVNFTGSGKTFTQSSGNITSTYINWNINNGASLALLNNLPVSGSRNCQVNGILDCGITTSVSGSGTFSLSSGGTLIIGSPNGITSSGATGNVQTSVRTFSTGANYIYDGNAAQNTGSGLPLIVNNLTINNAGNVALTTFSGVNGTLSLSNGAFLIGQKTFIFQNSDTPITRTQGTLTTDTATNLIFGTNGNTAGASFTIPAGTFTSPPTINNFSINRDNPLTLNSQPFAIKGVLLCNGQLNTNNNLTLISTSTQTALIDGSGTGQVSGNVVMQRYLPNGFGYKYVSSPFNSVTVSQFASYVDLNASFPTFYSYDESQISDWWINYTNPSDVLNPTLGYAANFGSSNLPVTVALTGVVNNGSISSPTLYNHNNPYTQGFNLAGNPYPSPVDWNAASGWTRTNIDNAIYYFNSGDSSEYVGTYSSYINGVSSDGLASNIIPAMQGYFIHVSNGTYPVSGSLTFSNPARINNLNPLFHNPVHESTAPLLRFTAGFEGISGNHDPMVIYFAGSATWNFDKDYDALKLMNTDWLVPNLYAISPDKYNLSIYALPPLTDTINIIPLGLETEKAGSISFRATDIENFPSNLYVYFADSKTVALQNLLLNKDISLNLDAGDYRDRFSLIFSLKDLQYNPGSKEYFYAYSYKEMLYIYMRLDAGEKGCNNLRYAWQASLLF